MSVVSNLYAAKLYSEHPLAIWPLDDDVSYISLITDEQRTFESASPYAGWTITNGTADDNLPLPDQGSPFNSNIYAGIQGVTASVNNTTISAVSPNLFTFDSCNQNLETFCIGMYVYQPSQYVKEYEIGYEYYENSTASWVQITTTFAALDREGWINLQDTFQIQEFDPDYCHIIFKAVVDSGGNSGDYNFIINGLTVGQWSENFISESLGAIKIPSPTSASLSLDACSAEQYGLLSDNAFYLVEDGNLLAKNEGVPMIYGSKNTTRLYSPTSPNPSLIFPNKKMFTEEGRYKNYTLETWIKLRPRTKDSKKIIGPIDTNDGIYVQEGFITLVINKNFISHNVSEWYRPMLLHLVVKDENIIMFINGEQVASLEIDRETMILSESNWMGIYTYSDFDIFEVDCISIFPYAVPLQVARKRFVWGQGTDPVELINNYFDGEEAVIQFSNAKYNVNYIYPDKERWDAGYYNNLTATTNSISVPSYSLPNINIGNRDITEWYDDNKALNDLLYPAGNHPLFFTFRPNIESSTWEPVDGTNWTEQSSLIFPSMSFLSSPLSAFYAIFEVEEEINYSRPLIHIVNTVNNKRFEINIDGYDVTYNFDGQELVGTGFTVDNTHFVVGFHIPTIIEAFNFELASFFGSLEFLQMQVGGNGTTTFESKIYRVSFSNQNDFNSISSHFDESTGIVDYQDSALLEGHYASYTLSPFFRYETYFLDISLSAQWEEYFPLSSFASYITKRDGSRAYDLDYLQINYGYPSLVQIVPTIVSVDSGWSYQELFNEYNSTIQKNYEILDNPLLSGYATYEDLSNKTITEYQIDTTGSSMTAYVTFQLLAEGANEPLSSFTHNKELTDFYTIYAELENTNQDPYKAYKTKFEIIDGTIVYPPKKIDFKDVAMVIHFNIEQDGIISNPIKIKNLEITSRCLNENQLTPIGTKSGMPIYPYVKNGIYFSGKSKNPVIIGKNNLPYLYLTEKTGVKVLKNNDEQEYGIIFPINLSESENYILGAAQLFIKYDTPYLIVEEQVVFNLVHQGGTIEFVLTPDSTEERFYISARNKNSQLPYTNIKFYINGTSVKQPYIGKREWNILSFLFPEPLNFSQYSGSINIFDKCWFDNVSFFKASGLNEFSVIVPRQWLEVLYNDQEENPINIVDWQYWYDENGALAIPNQWVDTYTLSEANEFSITPKEIYSTYAGTNIIIVDDNSGVSMQEDDFIMFADQTWLNVVQKPA